MYGHERSSLALGEGRELIASGNRVLRRICEAKGEEVRGGQTLSVRSSKLHNALFPQTGLVALSTLNTQRRDEKWVQLPVSG
jgi:hypothetical protein